MPGGRPVGSINKKRAAMLTLLQDQFGPDFNPIINMAQAAHRQHNVVMARTRMLEELVTTGVVTNDQGEEIDIPAQAIVEMCKGSDLKDVVDGWDKVASYLHPKLKAVELSADEDGGLVQALKEITLVAVPVDRESAQIEKDVTPEVIDQPPERNPEPATVAL